MSSAAPMHDAQEISICRSLEGPIWICSAFWGLGPQAIPIYTSFGHAHVTVESAETFSRLMVAAWPGIQPSIAKDTTASSRRNVWRQTCHQRADRTSTQSLNRTTQCSCFVAAIVECFEIFPGFEMSVVLILTNHDKPVYCPWMSMVRISCSPWSCFSTNASMVQDDAVPKCGECHSKSLGALLDVTMA